jgi:hypothetical protein
LGRYGLWMKKQFILPVINGNADQTVYKDDNFKPAEDDLLFHKGCKLVYCL